MGKLYQEKNTPYFPYGADEEKFSKSLAKNMPGLAEQRPDLLSVVLSIQPHVCDNTWLSDLCSYTNFNKHDRLKPQIRKDSPSSTVRIGNAIRIYGNSEVTFHGCRINGVPIGNGAPVFVTSSMPTASIRDAVGAIVVSRSYDWVEFHFEDSIYDVRKLLRLSREALGKYVADVYGLV